MIGCILVPDPWGAFVLLKNGLLYIDFLKLELAISLRG